MAKRDKAPAPAAEPGASQEALMAQLRERLPGLLPGRDATRAERDHAYVRVIEEMRRLGVRSYPHHFATVVLGVTKNALQRYDLAREAIRAYGEDTSPERMRMAKRAHGDAGARPVDAAALAAERSRADRAAADAQRLERELADATAALQAERAAHADTRRSLAVARAMVDELDDHLAHRSVPLPRDIAEKLHRAAAQVTGVPERQVRDAPAAAPPSSAPPRLTIVPAPRPASDGGPTRRPRGRGRP